MKDEIKEIINDLQRIADRKCYPEDILDGSIAQEWVDYITNLQEENEELKKNQRYHKKFGNDYIFCLEGDKETYKDYIFELQERIEKAIEYINQNKHLSMFADCREPEEDWNYDLEINPRDLLNILQGVGKE